MVSIYKKVFLWGSIEVWLKNKTKNGIVLTYRDTSTVEPGQVVAEQVAEAVVDVGHVGLVGPVGAVLSCAVHHAVVQRHAFRWGRASLRTGTRQRIDGVR